MVYLVRMIREDVSGLIERNHKLHVYKLQGL